MNNARVHHSATACNGSIWAFGSTTHGTVERFDVRLNKWFNQPEMHEVRQYSQAVCVDDKTIFVIGGMDAKTMTNDVERFDLVKKEWGHGIPLMKRRIFHGVVVIDVPDRTL